MTAVAAPSLPSAPPAATAAPATDNTVPGSEPQAAAGTSEKVQVKTDVYNLTFDTLGAQLVKAELIKYTAPDSKDQHMVLLDNSGSEEHTSELQSLMRITYAVFCLKKTNIKAY